MRKKICLLFLISLVCWAANPVAVFSQYYQEIDYGIHPAEFERIAQAGWQFLKLPTNARQAAMGGIMTVLGRGDASAAFTNPASLGDIEGVDLMVTSMKWIVDTDYTSGAIMKSIGEWGVIGANFTYVNYGDMIRNEYRQIEEDGIPTGRAEVMTDTGTFGAYDMAIGLSYARNITTQLQIGVNAKLVQEKLDDAKTSNWAFDIGTTYHTGIKSLRIAMVGRNFGPDVNFAAWDERIGYRPADVRMPMSFGLGAAFDFLEGKDDNPHYWTVAAEFLHPNDGPEKVNVGTEYSFMDFVNLRAGYRFNYDEESYTLGGGLKLKTGGIALSVNYSYWTFGILGSVNMFSVGFGF